MKAKTVTDRVLVKVERRPDGSELAYVDGLHVEAKSGQTPIDAAMERVRMLAASSGAGSPKSLLVLAVDAQGRAWNLRVDENGHREVVPSAAEAAARSPEPEASPERPRVLRWRRTPDTAPPPADDSEDAQDQPPPTRPLRMPRWSALSAQEKSRRAVIAAVLVLVLAAGAVAVRVLLGSGVSSSPVSMDTSEGQVAPGTAPAEWTGPVLWSTPPLLAEGGPARVTVVGSDRVALVDAERRVSLVQAATGKTLWSTDLPDGEVHGVLAVTTMPEGAVLAAHVGDRLVWWRLSDGQQAGAVDLPSGAAVSFAGPAPLLGLSKSTVGAVVDGEVRSSTLPTGSTALAASPTGVLTVASESGWWHVPAGQDPTGTPTPWQASIPGKGPAKVRPVSACGGTLIGVIPPSNRSGIATAVMSTDDPDTGVTWLAQGPMRLSGEQVTWRCSTSRQWGILSRSLLNFTSGTVSDLGPWTTTQMASDRALGQIGQQRVVTGPAIQPPGVLADGEAFPDDLVRLDENGDRVAGLVRWTVDGQTKVYALSPASSS